jgi:hypothetical protein
MTFVCKSPARPAWHDGERHSRPAVVVDGPTTPKEKAKIAAGAVTSLVIVGWVVVLAIAFMSVR